MMKVLFNTNDRYIIQTDKNEFCYISEYGMEFAERVDKFLRFDPYIEYVEKDNIKVPTDVINRIKEQKK